MEYVDGGSILDKIKHQGGSLNEDQIAVVMKEVLLGLQYLAMEGKIHRDIKVKTQCSTILLKLLHFIFLIFRFISYEIVCI